jgi:hypothetical protein
VRRDDEDDIGDDGDPLFGGSPGTQPDSTPIGSRSPTPSTASTQPTGTGKRQRSLTSNVWQYLDPLDKDVNGKTVRYGAKCKFCKKVLNARSSIGTGHLGRHVRSCLRKQQAVTATSQTNLHFASDGRVAHFEYNPAVARSELCYLIARLDLPLSLGASVEFEEYIRNAHNPRFVRVSRTTTTTHLDAYFITKVAEVKSLLSEASCVCLTSDIWSGNAKEDYLSVVVHFVTTDWELEKRIIGFRLIDCSHSGVNIAERILLVLADYELTSKVLSVTLDNASANASAMDDLTPSLSSYVGSSLLHQRCACYIINLIVKSGLKRLDTYLDDFRTTIFFLNSSNQRITSFKSYCLAAGVRPRKFGLDMNIRWNSTYLMLKHLVPYKDTFSVFIHTNYKGGSGTLLTQDHWYVADHILKFLEQFYKSTVSLSGIYYPTAPLMMHAIIAIANHLNQYENDNLLRDVIVPMKSKFLKYW